MAQISFSTIWSGITTVEEVKVVRDECYKHIRSLGFRAKRFVLKGQLRKWAGLGIPDGRVCAVYMIDTNMPWQEAKALERKFIDDVLMGYADQKYAAQMAS